MKRTILVTVIACTIMCVNVVSADTFGTGANEFTLDFVDISGDTNPASGYGIVAGDYRMGTYEITNDQWNKFTNTNGTPTGNPSNAYDESASWTAANIPTNELSWYEGAQFVNYLNTSNGYQAAYKFTEVGDYVVWGSGDAGYDAGNPYRNSLAIYFLPTEDEWVKAAYWNGTSMQEYATKAGESLTQGDGTSGTGWNYYDNGYATDPSGPWNAGSGSEELNGTFDMMSNMWEWVESPWSSGDYLSGSYRGVRGGSYYSYDAGSLKSSSRNYDNPYYEGHRVGFRVASVVPEPATFLILGLGWLVVRIRRA